MLKLVKSEGTRWYVKLFLASDTKARKITIECSENVVFDGESGGAVDGAWSEVVVNGNVLEFSHEGAEFEVSANILDGQAFSVCGEEVTVSAAAEEEPPFTPDDVVVEINEKERGEPLASHPIESWFTQQIWDELFPNANHDCFEGAKPYSYQAFIDNVRYFPEFASGTELEQKQEVAAFFGMALQEVGGKSLQDGGEITLPGLTKTEEQGFSEPDWTDVPSYKWNMAFSSEQGYEGSRKYDSGYPLKENQKYFYGAGLLQLSYPVNYARFSQFFFGDKEVLLNDSDRVRKEADLVVASGLFYWMAQAGTRPSCHCCFTGKPVNELDKECFDRITTNGFKKGFANIKRT